MNLSDNAAELAGRLQEICGRYDGQEPRAYSEDITRLAETIDLIGSSAEADALFREILQCDQAPEEIRYATLYLASVFLRHRGAMDELGKLFEDFGSTYRAHPTYQLINLTFREAKGLSDQTEAAAYAYQAQELAKRNPDDAGVLHLYAIIACDWQEQVLYSDELLDEDAIDSALEAVKRALSLSPGYAKFYATRARLHMLKGEWSAARTDLGNAIKYERRDNSSYVVNVSNYQYLKTKVLLEENRRRVEKNADSINDELEKKLRKMEDSTVSTIEMISFFAGVISLVACSVSILSGQPFNEAARLIIVLMGALLEAFSAFSLLLTRRKVEMRHVVVIALGACAIVGALVLGR